MKRPKSKKSCSNLFFEHPLGSKDPRHKFSISNMNCTKIWGLSDQSGRLQSKNHVRGVRNVNEKRNLYSLNSLSLFSSINNSK